MWTKNVYCTNEMVNKYLNKLVMGRNRNWSLHLDENQSWKLNWLNNQLIKFIEQPKK